MSFYTTVYPTYFGSYLALIKDTNTTESTYTFKLIRIFPCICLPDDIMLKILLYNTATSIQPS